MAGAHAEGPPVQGDAPIQMPISSPERLTEKGTIIDVKTTAGQYANVRNWFRKLSDVENGLVRRYMIEESMKRNGENKYERNIEYKKEFYLDPQGYFERLIMAKPPEEWQTELTEAIDLLTKLRDAAEDPRVAANELRSGLNNIRMGGKNEIGAEASAAMARFTDELTAEKKITREQRRAISNAIQKLIDQQVKVKTELLGANMKTRYAPEPGEIEMHGGKYPDDCLSPEAQAYVYRQFLHFKYQQDEGTDKRTAILRVLRDKREDAPDYVYDGRERDVYEAWLAGIEVLDKLETENDPAKRMKLERELEHHISIVEKWTSKYTGTMKDRMELGPTGVSQIHNIAWDFIKNTVNRTREESTDPSLMSNDLDNPTQVKKGWVNTGATYMHWETQALKNEVYVQYGAAWNAYRRIKHLRPDEQQKLIDLAFDGKRISKPDIKGGIRKLEEKRDGFAAGFDKAKEVEDIAKKRYDELKKQVNDLNTTYEAAAKAAQDAAAANDPDKFDKFSASAKKIREEQAALSGSLRETENAFREAEGERKKLEAQRDDAQKEFDKYDSTKRAQADIDADIAADETAAQSTHESLKQQGRQEQFNAFENKLRDWLESDGYIDFYSHFSKNEIELIAKMNNMGTYYNSRRKRMYLAPSMAETVEGPMKLEKKRTKIVKDPLDGQEREVVVKDAAGQEIIEDAAELGFDFRGDFVFINPASLPHYYGRLSVDAMQQLLRNPERYPKMAQILKYIQDNNCIVIVTSFAVENDLDGGSVEKMMVNTGKSLNPEKVREIKERYGLTNVQLLKKWIDDPRIQRELGVRPDEMVQRIIAHRADMHQWQRELLPEHVVINEMTTSGLASSAKDDQPMFFEFMIEQLMLKYGRLSAEDISNLPFDQQLPRTGESAYTVIKSDGTMQSHFRNEVLTDDEAAPKTELDLMYQGLMNQLMMYESHSKYYNQARNYVGPKSEDEVYKIGAFIKANVELINKKMLQLKALYYNPDPSKSPDEKLKELIAFRNTQMNHLTYELIDENGKIIASNKNFELWDHYNANIQWLGKLKREQKNSEDRYVDTWMAGDRALVPDANGITDMELAEADYLYNKNERLRHELEVYALGTSALGITNGMSPKEADMLLADKYADLDVQQMKRLASKQFRAVRRYRDATGPNPLGIGETMSRAFSLFMTSAANDHLRKVALRLNELSAEHGIPIHLPVDQKNVRLRPDQLEEILDAKDDGQIFERMSREMARLIKYGGQDSLMDVFSPPEDNILFPGTGAPGLNPDKYAKKLIDMYRIRRRDDFVDSTDRFFQRHILGGIFENLRFGGYRITELLNDVNNMRMSDTATLEQRPDGQVQRNKHGKKGTKMDSVDLTILQLNQMALKRGRINFDAPPDEYLIPQQHNQPTRIQQYYASLN